MPLLRTPCERLVCVLLMVNEGDIPSKRTVRNSGDAKLSTSLQQCNLGVLDINCEWGIFDLYGVDVVDFASATESIC